MAIVSAIVRRYVTARIGDDTSGWNYWIGQVWAPLYGLDPNSVPNISITSPGANYFTGQIDPRVIDATGYAKYPLCQVYNVTARDTHIVSPAQFGGIVQVGVDFWESFPDEGPPADVESSAEAIQDAMYQTFNSQDYYGLLAESGASYNNEMACQFGQLAPGGENWVRLSRYTLTFRVISGT